MDCPMDYMINRNLEARRINNPTPADRDTAARIVLRVARIMRCTVADLAETFSNSDPRR
jgi:hypothetical protein